MELCDPTFLSASPFNSFCISVVGNASSIMVEGLTTAFRSQCARWLGDGAADVIGLFISDGDNNTTGTLRKCSVGMRIYEFKTIACIVKSTKWDINYEIKKPIPSNDIWCIQCDDTIYIAHPTDRICWIVCEGIKSTLCVARHLLWCVRQREALPIQLLSLPTECAQSLPMSMPIDRSHWPFLAIVCPPLRWHILALQTHRYRLFPCSMQTRS